MMCVRMRIWDSSTPRNRIQETAFSVQFVPGMRPTVTSRDNDPGPLQLASELEADLSHWHVRAAQIYPRVENAPWISIKQAPLMYIAPGQLRLWLLECLILQ
eukprot:1810487-Rhodomonas_salina.1